MRICECTLWAEASHDHEVVHLGRGAQFERATEPVQRVSELAAGHSTRLLYLDLGGVGHCLDEKRESTQVGALLLELGGELAG